MNLIRFFLPYESTCYQSYNRNNLNDEIIVPRIGELVWFESECQEFVVKHIMHDYDATGDMVDVFLDYPEEDYFDYKHWENPDTIEHDDYMDNLADDCNCPECESKEKVNTKKADEYIGTIERIFNKLGYDVKIEVSEIEV